MSKYQIHYVRPSGTSNRPDVDEVEAHQYQDSANGDFIDFLDGMGLPVLRVKSNRVKKIERIDG